MKLKIVTDCSEVDWKTIAESLKKVGMAYLSLSNTLVIKS